MEENNEKDIFESEPIEVANEEKSENTPRARTPLETNALTAFILCCIGVSVCGASYFGAISCIVLNALAIKFNNKAIGVDTKPYSVFWKIVKVVAVIGLVGGIVLTCILVTKDTIKFLDWIQQKANSSTAGN